jgi:FHA domain-containing protein
MSLTLRAVSLNKAALSRPITATFDDQGGTIGRSDQNTMALPDPERLISRRHAQISTCTNGYVITNIGSANPFVVRNIVLNQGESTALMDRDSVTIGGYLLEVAVESIDDHIAAAAPLQHRASDGHVGPARSRSPPTPETGDARPLSPGNPFADLMREPEAPTPGPSPAATPDGTMRPLLPGDFNPLAPRRSAAPAGGFEPIRQSAIEASCGDASEFSIDDIIGNRAGDSVNSLDRFLSDAVTPAQSPAVAAHRHADVARPLVTPATRADQVPELHAAFKPPRALPTPAEQAPGAAVVIPAAAEPAPAVLPPPQRPAATHEFVPEGGSSADAQALWAAFCKGAGLTPDSQPMPTPACMEVAGALLRVAVDGTLQLMSLRSTTRFELRAAVTMIRPRNNNPLKFSPDAQSALEKLLQPPSRGFLPGPTAMTDAMNDLVGHAIGTIAGTRAALEGVLGRFGPAQLEGQLADRGMLDRLLPMNRKSRLWELYLQHYDAIRDEAQEDFHALFGKAFLAAYEQQLDRLQRERAASAR